MRWFGEASRGAQPGEHLELFYQYGANLGALFFQFVSFLSLVSWCSDVKAGQFLF